MNKSGLVTRLCNMHPGIKRIDLERIVNIVFSEIIAALHNSEFGASEIRNFGRFSIKTQRARVGRNPRTGGQIQIDTKKKIRFKASSTLLKRLNEN